MKIASSFFFSLKKVYFFSSKVSQIPVLIRYIYKEHKFTYP